MYRKKFIPLFWKCMMFYGDVSVLYKKIPKCALKFEVFSVQDSFQLWLLLLSMCTATPLTCAPFKIKSWFFQRVLTLCAYKCCKLKIWLIVINLWYYKVFLLNKKHCITLKVRRLCSGKNKHFAVCVLFLLKSSGLVVFCNVILFGTWLGMIRISWGKSPEWFGRRPRLLKGPL